MQATNTSGASRTERMSLMGLLNEPAGYVDGTNLYEYVRSGPTGAVDPYGLFSSGAPFPDVHGQITNDGLANSGLPQSLVDAIAQANRGQDAGAWRNRPPFSDPANHGDNGPEGIRNTIKRMFERWRNILNMKDKCANCDDVKKMLQEFGRILHAIQDLYAHSNYVERMDQAAGGQSRPGTIPLWDMSQRDADGQPIVPNGVTSGNYVHLGKAKPPTHQQMAKDNRTFPAGQVRNGAGTSMYDLAVDAATRATADAWRQFERQMRGTPAWDMLQKCIEEARAAGPASQPSTQPSELLQDTPK